MSLRSSFPRLDQSIPNNTGTVLVWNSERYDTAGMHSDTTNSSRIKAPVTGIYNITLEVAWSPFDPDAFRYIDLERNGTTEIAIDEVNPPPAGDQSVTTEARLRAGDFIIAFTGVKQPVDVTSGSVGDCVAPRVATCGSEGYRGALHSERGPSGHA